MIRTLAALALAALAAASAGAQERPDALDFAGDAFRAGGTVIFDAEGANDVFLAGERVELAAPIGGAAHLAGRRVAVRGAVAGALYAAGQDVSVAAPVGGAASLTGYDVAVAAPVEGNLRAAGAQVTVRAPVGGAALLTGRTVALDAPVAGDAMISAAALTFGEAAKVGGTLTLFERPGEETAVPAGVAPPERIERRAAEEAPGAPMGPRAWLSIAAGLVLGAVVVAALGAVAASVAPEGMSRLGAIVHDGPFRAFGAGFIAQSALVGAAILIAATVIGLFIAPFVVLAALLLGVIGYVVAVYLLGVWAVTRAGALEPDTFPEILLAAGVGALIAGLLALIPLLGWLVILALTLTGVGAMAIAAFRPHTPALR